MAPFQYEALLNMSILVEGKERNVSESNVMGPNGGAGCGGFFIQDNNQDYQNNLVNAKRKKIVGSLNALPKMITPIASFLNKGFLNASNMVERKRKRLDNDQAPCSALIAMSDVEPAKRKRLDNDQAPCSALIAMSDVEAAKRKRLVDAQAPFRAEIPISNVEASLDFLSAKKEAILKASVMVEGKERNISGLNVMGHNWLARDFVATHTHSGLSPACNSHLQIDPSQNNLVNAKRKELVVSLRTLLKLITPITTFQYQGFLKTSIMVERKETNVSGLNVMSRNGDAGCRSFFIRDSNQDYHNMFPNHVQIERRNGSFKIINADNSRQLQRLTEIDVLPMQFAEEGFKQKKHLEDGFNCFGAFCRHLVSHKWSVKEFVAAHTHHELSPTCKSHLQIDFPQKNLVNVKRKRVVNDQAPCSALIAMSDVESAKRKRLVNTQAPCRSKIPISDVEAALDFLSAKKDSDNGLFYETKFVAGHLRSVFWADSISQLNNACFGEVMAVYRTKLCMMHFVVLTGLNHHHRTCVFGCALLQDETVEAYTWLFQTFLHVMQGCMPLSVVTDDHQAIREAIKLVLPRSRHRLCTQHLEKIARSNVKNPFFISDFKACMLEVLSPDDFELKWKRMVEMYKVSENPWIQRMHRERHMWAETYLRESFSAGLQSTKICESIDEHLRNSSQNNLKLHEFLNEFECVINALWHEEGKAECKSAILQVARLSNPLKKHASDMFTWDSYKKFITEMRLESCLFVVNKDEGTDHNKYRLCNPENHNLIYEVMVKPSGPSIKCSCMKFETLGLPCCHVIHVLKSEGIEKIPQDLIHPRWTKSAKFSAQFWHRSLPPVSSDIMLKMMCYGNSAYFSSILCYCKSKSDKVRNLFLGGDHELERQIQDQLWCI
ncbi:protein FAR1-RELATED SEQUENCE 5-like [Lotus japonicus]|uniref:protein FAR1-RELATED SEQUENCE 5-like n=1 Tax=Lotus japonicus TaxID=34305 RepID=UPI002585C44E|nr:protein FAR1-RELATED SEQUENCE 5-like [Lotus japonicus]